MNDHQLHNYCQEWAFWCKSRSFYIRPGGQGVLARMQPSVSGVEPNARNNPDMQFFNMAIHALADMTEHKQGAVCFNLMYAVQAEHVKREADKLGIARSTYYRRVASFARKAYSMAASIKNAHLAQREREAGHQEQMCSV